MGSPHVRSYGAFGPRPQLPAFCCTRRPTLTVNISSLTFLRNLLVVVLLVQLSTLLLVIAGPVPPRPVSTSTVLPAAAGSAASGAQFMPPHSDR